MRRLLLGVPLIMACRRGEAQVDPAPRASASAAPIAATGAIPAPSATPIAAPSAGPDEDVETTAALSATGRPVVGLDGEAAPPPLPDPGEARLVSIALATDVRRRPDLKSPRVGVLRAGAVVALADPAPAGTAGCPGGWRRIQPFGFVCVGPEASLDLDHPIARASARGPDVTQKLPYMYGIVTRGGPTYSRIPSPEDIARFEPHLDQHLARWAKDKESGATYGLDVWLKWKDSPAPPALEALEKRIDDPEVPWFLAEGRTAPNLSGKVRDDSAKVDEVKKRNGVAFVDSFLRAGRRYNVSTDLRVIPADRFRPIRGSEFRGVRVGVDVEFPFALVRRKDARRWREKGKDKLEDAGELAWRAAVPLTGKQRFFGKKLHYETEAGYWIDDRSAGRVDPPKKMPGWAKAGEKWIDVNITKQILVAYEGERAVYATLVSTGEAGLEDPATTKSTKRGIFRVHTKYITTTMDSDVSGEEFELRDVPYVQYFEEGYALHGAYWHDGFGQPKSHGCINLSPEDARRLFWWTEPRVPPGWHGVAKALTGTVIFVHP